MKNMLYYSVQQILEAPFCNYKGSFIIILLVVVNADYLFKYAHVGMEGRTYDGVFLHSVFYNTLSSGILNVTQPSVLPGNDMPIFKC
jgi:hypothetical protein